MGRACNTHEKDKIETVHNILEVKSEGPSPFERCVHTKRTILTLMSQKWCQGQRPVVGPCKHRKETSGSITRG